LALDASTDLKDTEQLLFTCGFNNKHEITEEFTPISGPYCTGPISTSKDIFKKVEKIVLQ